MHNSKKTKWLFLEIMLSYYLKLSFLFTIIKASIKNEFLNYDSFMRYHWLGNLTHESLAIKAFPIVSILTERKLSLCLVHFPASKQSPDDIPAGYQLINPTVSQLFPHVIRFFIEMMEPETKYNFFFLPYMD
jgi:hypothetical protein